MSEKVLTDAELRKTYYKDYGLLLDRFPNYPIVMDGNVLRWKRKPLMDWISDQIPEGMNAVWIAAHRNKFPREDLYEFYQEVGYSLAGFLEVFGDELDLNC